jgi:hypothetical protein
MFINLFIYFSKVIQLSAIYAPQNQQFGWTNQLIMKTKNLQL